MGEKQKRGANIEQMRKVADDTRKGGGGDFYKFDTGDTLLLILPPCRNGDEYEPTKNSPFIPVGVHYQIGGSAMAASLDPEDNPIITHPFIKKELKKAGKKLTGKCPIKEWLESDSPSDEEADDSKLQVRYLWGIKPIGFRKSKKKDAKFMDLDEDCTVLMCGPQINDALVEIFEEHGDITDPDGAIRVVVSKLGGKQVSYKARAYGPDLKKPLVLKKSEKAAILKAQAGPCDLFRVVAGMVKPPSKLAELLEIEEDEDDDKPKGKKGKKDKKPKGKKGRSRDEDDDEDDEEDEEEEESDDDESEDDDSDDDDEEDEEEEDEKPKRAKKADKGKSKKSKSKSKDDDDEDDDEEEEDESEDEDEDEDDEDEDEEEEEKPKGKKGKSKDKKKSKSKDDDDDEDDLDLQNLEKELEEIDEDDDDEDEKPKSKKSKKSKK
jgi:hypothetical protein